MIHENSAFLQKMLLNQTYPADPFPELDSLVFQNSAKHVSDDTSINISTTCLEKLKKKKKKKTKEKNEGFKLSAVYFPMQK